MRRAKHPPPRNDHRVSHESTTTASGNFLVAARLWYLGARPAAHLISAAYYDALEFVAFDQEGSEYKSSGTTFKHALPSGSLPAGETVTGFLALDVPSNATVTRIVWTVRAFEWINQVIWK